jgi:hypothetical protein
MHRHNAVSPDPIVYRLAAFLLFLVAGLLFFTTYTLLVLFWAEIYHQARSMPTASLRPIFIAFNALVYACQVRVAPAAAAAG